MSFIYELARRLQFLDKLLPIKYRVPVRYYVLKICRSLESEIDLLAALVPKNSIAVDVGANHGTYTYPLEKVAREVVAFEPIPACAATVEAWAIKKNVKVYNSGLGDVDGSLKLFLPRINGRVFTTRASFARCDSECLEVDVPVTTLDSYNLTDVGFIKIDVEGFELNVLHGAECLISRCKPTLLLEVDPVVQSKEQFSAVFSWLSGRGYRSFYVEKGKLLSCTASIQDERPDLYNFVFIHS